MSFLDIISTQRGYRFVASSIFEEYAAYCPEPKLYVSPLEMKFGEKSNLVGDYSKLISTENSKIWKQSLVTKAEFEHARWDSSVHGILKRVLNFFGNRLMELLLVYPKRGDRQTLFEERKHLIIADMKRMDDCFSAMMKNDIGVSEAMDLISTIKIYEKSSPKIKLHYKDKFNEECLVTGLFRDTGDKHSKEYYWRTKDVLEKLTSRTQTQMELIYRIMVTAGHTLIPFLGTENIYKDITSKKSNHNFRKRFLDILDLLEDKPTKFRNLSDKKFVKLLLDHFGEKLESFGEYSNYLRCLPNRTIFTKSGSPMLLSWLFATFSINRSWPETQREFPKNYASLAGQFPYLTRMKSSESYSLGITVNRRSKFFDVYLINNIPCPPKQRDEFTECILTEFFLWYVRRRFLEETEISEIDNPLHVFSNVSLSFAHLLDQKYLNG